MKILVTGGEGFIGQHLRLRLAQDGHEVISLDADSTNTQRAFAGAPIVRLVLPVQWMTAGTFKDIDAIYHLACPASPRRYMADPIYTLDTAFNGTKAVLDVAKETGAKVLIASSSEVYGCPTEDQHPQVETYAGRVWPYAIRSCYDEGKRVGEALARAYEEKHNVTVQIARIFNTYGPGMGSGDGRVVSTFIDQALRGVPLTVHGDGKQTRSLCYIDDLVEGLVRLMAIKTLLGPVNLGNPEEITIHALAEEILVLTGSSSPILFDEPVAFDPARRCPDISKARVNLGWAPTISRKAGLQRTIAWWKEQAR